MTLKEIRIERLRQLQRERGVTGPVALGRLIGRKTNQTSDLLHGRTSFGEKVARSIEQAAGLPAGWLDRSASQELGYIRDGQPRTSSPAVSAALALDAGDRLLLPLLDGLDRPHLAAAAALLLRPPLVVDAHWASQLGGEGGLEQLRLVPAADDTMAPTVTRGDLMLTDAAVQSCERDGVYVLRLPGRMLVRRVHQRLDGQFELRADSPAMQSVDVATPGQFEVLARVLWVWSGRPL